jgi:phosphatidate cytidylyltransferase
MNGCTITAPAVLCLARLGEVLTARITTAIVLASVFVAAALWAPRWFVGTLFLVVGLLGALEWADLAGIRSSLARSAFGVSAPLLAFTLHNYLDPTAFHYAVLIPTGFAWLLIAAWIVMYEKRQHPAVRSATLIAVLGWVALVPTIVVLWKLHERAPIALLGLFGLVWCADIFAYFGGRALGRRRLAPHVSPGKTWEGLGAAFVGTSAIAAMIAAVAYPDNWFPFILVSLVTVSAAVIGDLFESLLKRLRGVKDSGSMLPGHGGVLDRIDSILAAAPIFFLSATIAGWK